MVLLPVSVSLSFFVVVGEWVLVVVVGSRVAYFAIPNSLIIIDIGNISVGETKK